MSTSLSADGAAQQPTSTKESETVGEAQKSTSQPGSPAAHDNTSSDSDSTAASGSESSSSESDTDTDSDTDSEDEESFPDLISALLAAASGVPLEHHSEQQPSSASSSIPSGLLLNPPSTNLAPTTKPNMRLAGGMVSESNPLAERLKAFLPLISEANRTLQESEEKQKGKWLLETDEEGGKDKQVIEMDLALGVLEEKKKEGEGTESKHSESDGTTALVQEVKDR